MIRICTELHLQNFNYNIVDFLLLLIVVTISNSRNNEKIIEKTFFKSS